MRIFLMFGLVVCALSTGVLNGYCQPYQDSGDFVIDPDQTNIEFEGQSTLHPVKGKIHSFQGEFSLNRQEQSPSFQGEIEIEVESLLTGNKGLDRNMHRMFESKQYPKAYCRIASTDENLSMRQLTAIQSLNLTLKIRGITQTYAAEVKVVAQENGMRVSGMIVVSLKSFELKPPTILGVIKMRDEVTVRFDAFLRKSTV